MCRAVFAGTVPTTLESNTIMTQVTKLAWEAKKTPFCRESLHHAHGIATAATTSRGPLRTSLLEFWGRRAAQFYFPRKNTRLSVWGRERALLSSSKDKRALWLHWGSKGALSVLPCTRQQNRRSADTPISTTASGLTHCKQKQQEKALRGDLHQLLKVLQQGSTGWPGLESFIALLVRQK